MTDSRIVLIVDDDKTILRICEIGLQAHFTLELANDADTAFDIMSQKPLYVVLSDFLLPVKNGLWVLEQAQSLQPNCRRALMTSGAPPATAPDLVQQFFAKPVRMATLLSWLG